MDQPGFWRFIIEDIPKRRNETLSFVLCNYTKSQWDNASYGSYAPGSRNYSLCISAAEETGPIQHTLIEGVLTELSGPPICLVTDLDGTLLGHDDALRSFNKYWERTQLFKGSLLVYNTGRNLKDFLRAAKTYNLLKPAVAICGVGTEIYAFRAINSQANRANSHLDRLDVKEYLVHGYDQVAFDETIQDADLDGPDWCPGRYNAVADQEWEAIMKVGFARMEIEALLQSMLPECQVNGSPYHDPFRVSITVNMQTLKCAGLSDLEIQARFQDLLGVNNLLLSGEGDHRYLDVLPMKGGKRAPVEYLAAKFEIPYAQILVCGDSGNDIDMFTMEGVNGCCVGNAQSAFKSRLQGLENVQEQDLWSRISDIVYANKSVPLSTKVHFSRLPCAAGILEATYSLGLDLSTAVQAAISEL
eukprot:Protomagalhaensia_sp_Gyna_25__1309@NODE_1657_length_1653_cov_10_636307_g1355_i0_p1_GENE_NODE_1657_length_1653_cov_10_636307_g1355_i0NODE_1657_length_1653_cov_10_636307_g1355_i0_p1_ORF_typecomplete_len472_score15_47S6PP/PF05116_13/3e34Hydrolase_3/PF08282_12/2_9e18CBM_25/PF03423_13/4e08HAD/PF12710_7/3_5e02HAD/PF12710_7/0_18_NODE_1657_length_1653_cov_10_636307_g1355_i01691416